MKDSEQRVDRPGTRPFIAHPGAPDRLAEFRTLITVTRWAMLAVGVSLALPAMTSRSWHVFAWLIVLCAYTVWRTAYPIVYRSGSITGAAWVIFDVGLNLLAVVATGYWDSPFVFSLLTAVVTAGFAEGFGFSLRVAATSAAAVSIPLLVRTPPGTARPVRSTAQWSIELVLVALVAGYGRNLFGRAEERTELALDRMSRLAEANALLFSLHRVAQALPNSLDLDEVLDSSMVRMHDLLGYETAAILVRDESTETWMIAASENVRTTAAGVSDDRLPLPLMRAARSVGAVCVGDLTGEDGPGFSRGSRSGLYCGLRARGNLVSLVALEHSDWEHFGDREVELLEGLAAPAALAIDNARWFGRLRTVAAEEERTRIARDLHDRIGQSLAYVAFELDRLAKRTEETPIHDEVRSLRQDMRQIVGEVRETLFDLRTDVSEQQDIETTIGLYLDRLRERSGLEVEFSHRATARLPLPQERELWRIAQEAIVNVERHAQAARARVRWWTDGKSASIEVSDDGRGLPTGTAGRIDAYGMLGMRERADAIGAHLKVESSPGRGTIVRCNLEPQ